MSLLCQQHTWETISCGKLPTKEKKDNGPGWGEREPAAAAARAVALWWHQTWQVSSGSTANHCLPLPVPGSGRTLRETVLESSPILALLNESFISSWSLVKELEELQVSVTATAAAFAFSAGECRRCLTWGCQQEGGVHTCTSEGFQFQALCVLVIAGAKQTPDGGRLREWHNDPLHSVMVPILKAKPDASLQDSPAQGHLCHQQTDFSVTQGATKYCLNPESPDCTFPHLPACLWPCAVSWGQSQSWGLWEKLGSDRWCAWELPGMG